MSVYSDSFCEEKDVEGIRKRGGEGGFKRPGVK